MASSDDLMLDALDELVRAFARWVTRHPEAQIEDVKKVAKMFGFEAQLAELAPEAEPHDDVILLRRKTANYVAGIVFSGGSILTARPG